jgi:NAD+ kinase
MTSELRLIIVADLAQPRVCEVWPLVDRALNQPGVVRVATDHDRSLDFSRYEADLVVVVGGDGAILRTCRQMGLRQLPILGVNAGRLGFLADLSPADLVREWAEIVARRFEVTEHLMFACRLESAASVEEHLGLNELVVSSAGAMRLIDIELDINGEHVTTYSADGLMISTPVGSTAHNLAAGGPILRQTLQAFVVTPICPHTLTNRPIVEDASAVFSLRVPEPPEGATLVIDGQIRRPLAGLLKIELRKAPTGLRMAKLPRQSYYATLHRKLGWGGQTPRATP